MDLQLKTNVTLQIMFTMQPMQCLQMTLPATINNSMGVCRYLLYIINSSTICYSNLLVVKLFFMPHYVRDLLLGDKEVNQSKQCSS